MTSRFLVPSLALVLLGACATVPHQPPRVDGSTPEAFRASWSRLVASLSSNEQAQLNTAVLLIGATKQHDSGFKDAAAFSAETLRLDLDGKTYADIVAAAKATGAKITGIEHAAHAT
jgi:hypothetical protein